MNDKEISMYSKFQYTEKDRLKWYTDKKGQHFVLHVLMMAIVASL